MKENPILYKGPMVRATLEGRKTQTRRVVTPHNANIDGGALPVRKTWPLLDFGKAVVDSGFGDGAYLKVPHREEDTIHRVRPRYQVGDHLWVRHSWWHNFPSHNNEQAWDEYTEIIRWKSGHAIKRAEPDTTEPGWRKRPSIHMPRWASRILLEITGIRVERIQDISTEDAMAEGAPAEIPCDLYLGIRPRSISCGATRIVTYRESFQALWDSINAERGYEWDKNPHVWVIEFKRIEP